MAEGVFDKYAKLRDDGYSAWSAAADMMLREKQRRAMEADYRKLRATRYAKREPSEPKPVKLLDDLEPHELADREHVAMVNRAGGFPIGTPSGPVNARGEPWRAR